MDATEKKQNALAALPAVQSMATTYGLSPEQLVYTFKAIAMPASHSDAEFVACCLVAREHGLNPLTKEIYFMKTKSGTIQPIVSVDGWVRKCNEHPMFDGMEIFDVNDAEGKLQAATCIMYRKDRAHPVKITEDLDECAKHGGPVWKTHPRRMLRHRALTQAARYAFGFAGLMDQDEFLQWQGMKDITPDRKSSSAAKKDGTTEKFNEIRKAIADHYGIAEMLQKLRNEYDEDWRQMPARWLEILDNEYEDALSSAREAAE